MTDYHARQDRQIQADLQAHYDQMAADGVALDPLSAAYDRAAWPDVVPSPEIEPDLEPEAGVVAGYQRARAEPTPYDAGLTYDPDLGWDAFPGLPARQPRPVFPDPAPAELAAEAEAEWADNWDGFDAAAYAERVEAGLEPEDPELADQPIPYTLTAMAEALAEAEPQAGL